ncbi:MAG: helix-turn-helix transcriptional regulator [Candidatus Omnitrophota bacterium]
MPSFHEKFSDLMLRRRLSQTEASKALGVDQKTVSNWMSGKILPKPQKIRLISEFFSIPTDILADDALPLPSDIKEHLRKVQDTRNVARARGGNAGGAEIKAIKQELAEIRKALNGVIERLDAQKAAQSEGGAKKQSSADIQKAELLAKHLKSIRGGKAQVKLGA